MPELAADLSDLRAWSRAVGKAGTDLDGAEAYARSHIADADFGRILELITGDYNAMIGQFHDCLDVDGQRLGATSDTIQAVAEDLQRTDEQVSQDFGIGRRIVAGGGGGGFPGASGVGAIPAPSSAGEELPEVSFGYILDKCCDLIVWVGGPDPREYVTKWIAGDIGKASLHASAWDHLSDCVDGVQRNLSAGQAAISASWRGQAAASAAGKMEEWVDALAHQSGACAQVAAHVRDMVQQAVQVAQVIVDIIKTIISIVSAALSSAYIPGWGQWKAIKTVKEAITLVNNARKVLTVFWNTITMIKDYIILAVGHFTAADLPTAPAGLR